MFMRTLAIVGALACVASGCGRRQGPPPSYVIPSAAPEVRYVCDVDGLNSQRDGYSGNVYEMRKVVESASKSADVTVVRRQIGSFENEIDAKYRAVTSSCRVFQRCMQANAYQEGECRSTLMRWERADADFDQLAIRLREIEAEVDRLRIVAGGRSAPRVNRREPCGSRSVEGVFSQPCGR